jgi:UDPglucose 6-dehydrogenase
MKIAVVGAGRVGLVTGLVLWENRHEVVLIDEDADRVAALARGDAPFFEPGLPELLARGRASGVTFTTEVAAALACDVAILCVPTPGLDGGAIDTGPIAGASSALASAIASRGGPGALRAVLVRSTVVPGTTRQVVGAALGSVVDRGVLPEFLREGSALDDARKPDRIVVGGDRPSVYATARALHAGAAPLVEMTVESAELVKYASNTLLALCVSFSNELARIAEHLPGVDARDVLDALSRDRRLSIGAERAGITSYLEPGPGFGGSCLGKDVRALAAMAREHGEPSLIARAVLELNREQPARFVERIERAMGGLAGRSVLVLGLSFKPHTDDVRESIALPVVAELEARGARVACHDPAAATAFLAARRGAVALASDWRSAAVEAEGLVLLAGWPEYVRELPALLARRTEPVLLADARGLLRDVPRPPGVRYLGIGRGPDERGATT